MLLTPTFVGLLLAGAAFWTLIWAAIHKQNEIPYITESFMRVRIDKLTVSCYALHGDTCCIAPHCRVLGCASGFWADDYVLAARFAYLQEAIDYCLKGSKRSGIQERNRFKIGINCD